MVQWFAVLGAVLAGVRYYVGDTLEGRIRGGIASGLLSFGGLLSIVPGSLFPALCHSSYGSSSDLRC
ncbi:hypothetical protein AHiyo8_50670 [Arthrobacter sp. Hiyo8]|nr:hypothetical protein AHiyo8_50670 [Arthrobacter sp. Hiyo8]